MREKKKFAERSRLSNYDRTVKRYFLVYEGADTERIYFDAINDMRLDIGINPLIKLVPLIRSYSEEGWSNPKKILDRIIKNLEESKTGCISYETLLNRIMDYLHDEKNIYKNKAEGVNIWRTLVWICEEELGKILGDDITDIEEECNEIVAMLYEKFNLIHVFTDISRNIMNGGLTYAEGFDKICLIVDRDRNSFISSPNNDQYAYVLSKCNDHKFGLYITNPCFEFWLLLHFDEVFNLDQNKLLENPKVTAKRRYAENELKRMFVGFRKNSYNAKALIKNVDKAIANEKKFCEDLEKLENTLGSNIGILIEEMRKQMIM